MPGSHVQKLFRTYDQEYRYTLNIIKQVQAGYHAPLPHASLLIHPQAASRHHPGLFAGVVSILNAATADKHRGLVATLPELSGILHNAGLHKIAGQCVEYAQFVSDVAADGYPCQTESEDEDEEEHEDEDEDENGDGNSYDGDDDGTSVAGSPRSPTPCTHRNVEIETDSTDADFEQIPHLSLDSGEETECEEQTAAETEPEKSEPHKMASMKPSASKKRKKPPSGVLPQRKSVRQWNRIPDRGEFLSSTNAEWAFIGQSQGVIDFV